MLNITLKVSFTDGTSTDVTCKTSDYIAFEQHFDKPVSILEQGRLTYLLWLAWKASRSESDFDTWVDSVESVTSVDDVDEIPPLGSPQHIG